MAEPLEPNPPTGSPDSLAAAPSDGPVAFPVGQPDGGTPAPPPSASPQVQYSGQHDPQTGSPLLTYREHLVELRDRLIKSVVALAIASTISFTFTSTIFAVLTKPADDVHLIYTGVAEMLTTYIKVAFIAGVVLATPVWLYQVIAFVAPGLTKNERRFLYTALPGVLACFTIGVAFGYFVLLPPALNFLLHFGEPLGIDAFIRVGDYISTVTGLLFWLGVVFETPLIIYLLARLGIVTPKLLAFYRRHAIVAAFVIAAVITPTVDPINQSLVAAPIIVLYEVGILLAKIAVKARRAATEG